MNTEQPNKMMEEEIAVTKLYEGKKDFWREGTSVHLTFLEHRGTKQSGFIAPFIEIIAFDPVSSVEAPYIYVSLNDLFTRLSESPTPDTIMLGDGTVFVTNNLKAKYLHDRILISSNSSSSGSASEFRIDLKPLAGDADHKSGALTIVIEPPKLYGKRPTMNHTKLLNETTKST